MPQSYSQRTDSGWRSLERHTVFPVYPYDPPSSPPPNLPLPPLPEISLFDHGSPGPVSTAISLFPKLGGPLRPPRPQTSLPDLKPRTIKSPEMSERQRHSEAAARTRSSPTHAGRRERILQNEIQSQRISNPLNSVGLLSQKLPSTSTFSEHLLSALPRLFSRLSPRYSPHVETGPRAAQGNGTELWHARQRLLAKNPSRVATCRKETTKLVARSPLFIPKTPPERLSQTNNGLICPGVWTSMNTESCLHDRSWHSRLDSPKETGFTRLLLESGLSSSGTRHKRSFAVTSFEFDSGNVCSPDPCMLLPESREHLTSLPRLPSDPVLLLSNTSNNVEGKGMISFLTRSPETEKTVLETATFAALPYWHTLQTAGPKPRTDKGLRTTHNAPDTAAQAEVGQVRQLTVEEVRKLRLNKILWAIATVSLVVVATSGILIGIVWKLRALQ